MIVDPERVLVERLVGADPAEASALLARMQGYQHRLFNRAWRGWANPAQLPPEGDWRVWLMLAGRGFGKTRAGAEWVQSIARASGRTRIALVAATMDEARAIMVEGESGLLALGSPNARPKWEPSLGRLTWRSGAIAHIYSADNPDCLRGPQHRYAWCDELAKWSRGEEAWMNLMMGLREGPSQRVLVTTTPRPGPLLARLIRDPRVARTGGRTIDNLYLSRAYIDAVQASYAGTRLGRQELDGEFIEEAEGALWTREMIEACRVSPSRLREGLGEGVSGMAGVSTSPPPAPPASGRGDWVRTVIGVDPPASANGDACGIVAVGLDRAGIGHVVEDASVTRPSPDRWARAVSACAARWGADRVVAEANNGGDMVEATLRAHDRALPVRLVHASRGKVARAEPVALLYEAGRVKHATPFPALEDQLCGLLIGGGYAGPGRSPDRADALVWAITELMLKPQRAEPRILFL